MTPRVELLSSDLKLRALEANKPSQNHLSPRPESPVRPCPQDGRYVHRRWPKGRITRCKYHRPMLENNVPLLTTSVHDLARNDYPWYAFCRQWLCHAWRRKEEATRSTHQCYEQGRRAIHTVRNEDCDNGSRFTKHIIREFLRSAEAEEKKAKH